jgi:hypothetical protein
MSLRGGSTPRQTDWLNVSGNVTLTLIADTVATKLVTIHQRIYFSSDHRPRSSESATPVIVGQQSSPDRTAIARIGRLPSRCPPKLVSDRRKDLSSRSARSPAAAARIA